MQSQNFDFRVCHRPSCQNVDLWDECRCSDGCEASIYKRSVCQLWKYLVDLHFWWNFVGVIYDHKVFVSPRRTTCWKKFFGSSADVDSEAAWSSWRALYQRYKFMILWFYQGVQDVGDNQRLLLNRSLGLSPTSCTSWQNHRIMNLYRWYSAR